MVPEDDDGELPELPGELEPLESLELLEPLGELALLELPPGELELLGSLERLEPLGELEVLELLLDPPVSLDAPMPEDDDGWEADGEPEPDDRAPDEVSEPDDAPEPDNVPELDDEPEPDEEPSAAWVWESSSPEACRPCCCWNCCSAACVFGPILPSTGPVSIPLSFSACCACLTAEVSAEDDDDPCEACSPPPCEACKPPPCEPCALLLPGLAMPCAWLTAKALEHASATAASLRLCNFMVIPFLWWFFGEAKISSPRRMTRRNRCGRDPRGGTRKGLAGIGPAARRAATS